MKARLAGLARLICKHALEFRLLEPFKIKAVFVSLKLIKNYVQVKVSVIKRMVKSSDVDKVKDSSVRAVRHCSYDIDLIHCIVFVYTIILYLLQ